MTFDEFCKAKFDRGHAEHGDTWDSKHINARLEIKNELADLYNYAELLTEADLAKEIRTLARELWTKLDNLGQHGCDW